MKEEREKEKGGREEWREGGWAGGVQRGKEIKRNGKGESKREKERRRRERESES